MHGQHVDVFVTTAAASQLAFVFDELWWIHDDHIKLLALLTVFTQQLEDISANELGAAHIKTVQLGVLTGDIQRWLGYIHVHYLLTVALQGKQAKRAGIAEAVQYFFAIHIAAGCQAAFTLVEVETGFVTFFDIHQNLHAIFTNWQQFWWLFTVQQTGNLL